MLILTVLDNKVSENNGVWALPDGDDFTAWPCACSQQPITHPSYLHDFGLSEVDRIQAEILDILEAEGWDVSEGFPSGHIGDG